MGLRENMTNKGVFIMSRWLEKFVSDRSKVHFKSGILLAYLTHLVKNAHVGAHSS